MLPPAVALKLQPAALSPDDMAHFPTSPGAAEGRWGIPRNNAK